MDLTVKESVQQFYDINQFSDDGGVNDSYAWIKFWIIKIPIPNPKSRKNNLLFHDINHLLTNNDTSWRGESSVSAWEIASGGWQKFYFPWILTLWAMGLGTVFYPKTTIEYFKKGLTMRNALNSGLSKTEILNFKVSDLIIQLSNQPKTDKSLVFWMVTSFLVFISPFIVLFLLIKNIIQII
jgi:hypothetical protein